MTLTPGTRLGPYEILAPLGAGGMGEVYRARDTRLGREVALKVLPASFAADPDRLRRFEQEARAASALNHPNILTIHDIGTHEGSPYVVSELLEGETLRERLPLGQRKALECAQQVARGLAAAHEKSITHRDLKPENIFLTQDGRVKILDFGLAKLTLPAEVAETAGGLETQPGSVLGTVGYMSPEQVRGQAADHRSDIFSFGTILYEMLSGQRAFQGGSAVETMSAILKEEPPELAVAPGLERVVRHCLEKQPQERFQSARDLAFALEALSGVFGPSAVEAPAVAPAASRRRLRWAFAVLALLAGLAGGIFLGRPIWKTPVPQFQRLTFRRGTIWSARFAPDGKTIIYGALWEGRPTELFSTRPETPESRSLLPGADIFAISSSGEMAISLNSRSVVGPLHAGTLARMSLGGGAPREILEDVTAADWAPDGKSLAVARRVGERFRVEFPVGKVLYETPPLRWVHHLRVSPKGDMAAFVERSLGQARSFQASVEVVELAGQNKKRTLSRGSAGTWSIWGLAWSPRGDEVWFTAVEAGDAAVILAVTPAGRERLIARLPGGAVLHDIARDGSVLLDRYNLQVGIVGLPPGETRERDLSWADYSVATDLTSDGRTLLFTEAGRGVGPGGAVYLRKTDGSPAVRLGEGRALALSPDGKWALAMLPATPSQLVLLPAGAGEARPLERGSVSEYRAASWFPDGKRILFAGSEAGAAGRLYTQDLAGGKPQPISAEGVSGPLAISPDGKLVAAVNREGKTTLFPVDRGEPRPIPGLEAGEVLVRWSADGGSLYVHRTGELPARIYRVDLANARKELWKELMPADAAGLGGVSPVLLTPDGKSYVYSYGRFLNDLYLVQGWK